MNRGRSFIYLPVLISSRGPNYHSLMDARFPVWQLKPFYRPDRQGD